MIEMTKNNTKIELLNEIKKLTVRVEELEEISVKGVDLALDFIALRNKLTKTEDEVERKDAALDRHIKFIVIYRKWRGATLEKILAEFKLKEALRMKKNTTGMGGEINKWRKQEESAWYELENQAGIVVYPPPDKEIDPLIIIMEK